MRAKKTEGALPAMACAWLWTGTARAAVELPMLTPDDNLGLLAMLSGMMAVWFYFRMATDEPR